MKLILNYCKKYKGLIALCLVLLVVQATCNLILPNLMSDMVNTGIVELSGQAAQQGYIMRIGGLMLLVAFATLVAAVLGGYFSSKISSNVAHGMRRDVFEKVESFSVGEFDKFSVSSLITRTTNDIQQIQNLINMALRLMVFSLVMGVGGTVMALVKSPSLSWIIALAVIVLIGLICVLFAIVVPKFDLLQKLVDKLNLISRENLSGMMVIRAFGNEQYEEGRFDETNAAYKKTNRMVQRVMSCLGPAMTLIMNVSTVAIVWVGASAIASSGLLIGDMMAFIQYAMFIIMSFLMLSMMFVMLPRAAVSAKRIQEVLETEPTILEQDNVVKLELPKGQIEFKNVDFRYEGAEANVLSDISFTAYPGQTTAFIGSTGSGKSTLVNLIPRFYDVTGGKITLDGVDIRDMALEDLHDLIGYVPQKGILFSGTIYSNLQTGKRNASEEEAWEALVLAQAKEFVEAKGEGIDSRISQGGSNVSGGQKQRLSIARALVKKPPVYIFDDSFSALDYATDAKLRAALAENTGDSTVLIVAQRVSTIMNADQIVVLEKGRTVGIGTHSWLLENCQQYREIAESQLSKEELA